MKPLTITIQPPITEHCSKCEYEAAHSFGSTRVICPECKEQSVRRGARPPMNRPISVTASYGSYNLANYSDKSWQYTIRNIPEIDYASFVVEEELDTDDPIQLIIELNEIIQGYWLNSSKDRIKAIVEIVSDEAFQERQEALRTIQKMQSLERQIYELNSSTCYYETKANLEQNGII